MPNRKMSLMGVGGKIAIVVILWIAVTEGISLWVAPFFRITDKSYGTLVTIGIVMAVVGFVLNLTAAFTMMKAYKNDKLATGGWYSIFLNPMYALQVLITIPGLLLLLNSWLALTAVPFALFTAKRFAKEEERYLEDKFGPEYRAYKEKVICKFL